MPVSTRSKTQPPTKPPTKQPTTPAPTKQKPKPTKQPSIFQIIADETTKPARKTYPTRKVTVDGPNEVWSIDLAVMTDDKDSNDGMSMMLNCVDIFSRFAWSIPIPDKTMNVVLDGLKEIVKMNNNIYPKKLWTDQGGEFINSAVNKWCKENNITLYSTYGKAKSAFVERFNRTIKTNIWKFFISNNTHRWVDILPKLMLEYNMRKHRAINMSPKKAHNLTEAKVSELYDYQYRNVPIQNEKPQKFHVVDYVRISRIKGTFEKGYHPSWSLEIFKIIKANNTVPWTYDIEDNLKEQISGSFYEPELQHTKQTPESDFLAESTLRTRTVKGKKQYLIKWLGYPENQSTWEDFPA